MSSGQATRASKKDHAIAVYVILDQAFSRALTLGALDSKQIEVGRATAKVSEAAGVARYVEFPFDAHTPMADVVSFELR